MSEQLTFSINMGSSIAVYIQIENQIQFAIAAGKLKAGDSLPSVRDLSSELDVNPNTVTKAYRDLELTGLVVTRRGVGVNVSDKARSICKKHVRAMVTSHLKEAVSECLAGGLKSTEIRKILSDTIAKGAAPYSTD